MTSEEPLVLGDVVDDLVLILSAVEGQFERDGSASYESVQREVSEILRLHLLSYIRYLEGESFLTYDRISDEMRVTPEGKQIQSRPEDLHDSAREAFGDHIAPEQGDTDSQAPAENDSFSEMFDEMADEMDSAFGGVSEDGPSDDGPSDDNEEWKQAESKEQVETSGVDVFGAGPQVEEAAPQVEEEDAAEDSKDREINAPVSNPGWSTSTQGSSMTEEVFERIEELGSGGIGTVFRGRQVRLDRDVAIKEIREIFSVFADVQREDILERFRSIVKTQASLLHPNIIQLIDVDTSGEFPFSVMQLAPNGNLRRLIEYADRPPLAVALKYFLQILHALNTAHDQGVVHGSLKPENVVLDQAGNAMVSDFGISRIVERDGGRGNQVYVGVGSVAYMAPEQFQDPNLATIKSDIYSLGIMLYEMLTGKVPGRRSPMPSSFFPDIPRALDDIFDRMSMDRQEDRYDSVDEIITDIYQAEKVLAILDKRSGVLFLRDPITYGATGLGEDAELNAQPAASVPAETPVESVIDDEIEREEDDEALEESEVSEVSEVEEVDEELEENFEEEGEVGEQESDEESVSEVEDEEEDDEQDDEEESAFDDDDVLNRLDKYGELFEED